MRIHVIPQCKHVAYQASSTAIHHSLQTYTLPKPEIFVFSDLSSTYTLRSFENPLLDFMDFTNPTWAIIVAVAMLIINDRCKRRTEDSVQDDKTRKEITALKAKLARESLRTDAFAYRISRLDPAAANATTRVTACPACEHCAAHRDQYEQEYERIETLGYTSSGVGSG
ncbi:hypothetical protein HOY82DRAFT_610074 [Tuber indicum]|nr:hypothetical protein HOY82DRAFT_610074 [Tuber indicum]